MGMHAMYDDRRPLPPVPQRNWAVEFIDPETGKKDRFYYLTQKAAEDEAAKLLADHGIEAGVFYRPGN